MKIVLPADHQDHQAVTIHHDDQFGDVDENLAPLLFALWHLGILTMRSCQEIEPGVAYIQFADVSQVERFFNAIATVANAETDRLLWQRIVPREKVDGAWRYALHPLDNSTWLEDVQAKRTPSRPARLSFTVSVRFPASDVPQLLIKLWKRYVGSDRALIGERVEMSSSTVGRKGPDEISVAQMDLGTQAPGEG